MVKRILTLILVSVFCAPVLTQGQEQEHSNHLYRIFHDDKLSWIDATGKEIINLNVGGGTDFSEGLAYIFVKGKWGFIDETGKIFIKPRFAGVSSFKEGLARVTLDWGKWGYIDKTGTMVIAAKYDEASDFSEGLARVRSGGKCGFIDRTGAVQINFQFSRVDDFSEGLAFVTDTRTFIDRTGQIAIIDRGYTYALKFSEGLAAVEINGKWGFIDQRGEIVIAPRFDSAEPFSEGLAPVEIAGEYCYIDKEGIVAVRPQSTGYISDVDGFSEGLAKVLVDNKKWGYIDRTGKMVIEPHFDSAYDFSRGFALVETGEKENYIDKTGRYIWKPEGH